MDRTSRAAQDRAKAEGEGVVIPLSTYLPVRTRKGEIKKLHPNGKPMGLPVGSIIVVDGFYKKHDINKIRDYLKHKYRELLLFELGISNGLRAGDILNLRVRQVNNLMPGDHILIRETKNNKPSIFYMSENAFKAFHVYISASKKNETDFIFTGVRHKRELTTIVAGRMIQGWARACGIKGHFGCHSLRKTWAYHARVQGFPIEIIMSRLNHSELSTTMRYLGIAQEEIKGMLLSIEL